MLRRRLRIVAPEADARPRPDRPRRPASSTASCTTATTPIEPLRGGVYGVAVDLGTTTVVLELVDLLDGRTLEVVALENPQRFGGSDVINRISYDEADGGGELRNAVRRALNRELGELYERAGDRPPRGLRGRGRRQRDDARPLLRPRRRARSASGPTSRSASSS